MVLFKSFLNVFGFVVTETQGLHLSICGGQAFPHRYHPSTEEQVHVPRLPGVALVEEGGAEEQPSRIVYGSSKCWEPKSKSCRIMYRSSKC